PHQLGLHLTTASFEGSPISAVFEPACLTDMVPGRLVGLRDIAERLLQAPNKLTKVRDFFPHMTGPVTENPWAGTTTGKRLVQPHTRRILCRGPQLEQKLGVILQLHQVVVDSAELLQG